MFKKKEYWETRYKQGGNSGLGSVGKYRDWKWEKINSLIPETSSVIDVGCGDLQFWENRGCASYVGIDLSPTIIEKNRMTHPDWEFICGGADIEYPLKADVVFCLDILFHIMDDNVFNEILNNLKTYSKEWIVIYTWDYNPMNEKDNGTYQSFRRLPVDKFKDEFELVLHQQVPYDRFGALYIFRRNG